MSMPLATPAGLEAEFETRLRAELQRRTAVTPAMFHSIDEKGRLISVSDVWLAKLGYSRDEVLGRPSSDFLTAESREHAIRDVLPEFFRLGRCENVQYQMVRKDGGVIDVLLSAVLDNDPLGRGRMSLAVMTDVTALRQAEHRLAESEARYRGLVEDQSELVSLTTPEGELRYVNHAYASFYGKQPEEMIGCNLFDFLAPDNHAAVAEHLLLVCAARHSIEIENQAVMPNGKRRWLAWTNRAITDGDGRITAIHSVARDIDERIRAEQRLQVSETRYRFLADNSSDLIVLLARDGTRLYVSPACHALTGYFPEEMLASRTADMTHPDDTDKVLGALAGDACQVTMTYRLRRKDGSYVWVETVFKPVEIDGRNDMRLAIVRDIDARVGAEQRLKDSEARYRLLADNSTDMVFQLDHDLVRRYVSPACRELLGYQPEEMIGIKPVSMAHPEDAARLSLVFETLMSGRADRQSIINRIRHRSGKWIWVEAQLRALKDPETGATTGIIGALRDISVRKAVEDKLEEANRRLQALAGQDGLTALANRRTFDEAFAKEHRRAKRETKPLSLVMLDVDRFKIFNDRYGHPAGDDCLRRVAAAIAETARRPGDVVARYGGEEFAVVLPDTDEAGAEVIAERIRQAVYGLKIHHEADANGVVTISAGVACTVSAGLNSRPETLMQDADRALYGAKASGRNAVIRASAMMADPESSRPKHSATTRRR
jgi:diguanylate cyclase (GGDEF)-like protein/PAS domain S-box-containing protein